MALSKAEKRIRIKRRIRKTITGTTAVPRLSIFRSNKEIYAQVIDDATGTTLAAASSLKLTEAHGIPKVDQATVVGKKIAEAAKAAGLESVVINTMVVLRH
jgi:large subunit ribosomal protein L18